MTHPLDVENLLVPALSGVVGALADRGGSSIPEYDARAQESWKLIQSFRPRDSVELMLVGQLMAFHEMLADGTRDLLRGMTDSVSMKLRARSGLVAIGRVCLGYIDRLEKRGLEPHRAELAAPAPVQAAAQAAQPKADTDHSPLAAASLAVSSKAKAADFNPHLAPASPRPLGQPETDAMPEVAAANSLDERRHEQVNETPAALAARASVALQALAAAKAAPPAAMTPAKSPVVPLGAKGWYVDVGAPSMFADTVASAEPRDAAARERNRASGGD